MSKEQKKISIVVVAVSMFQMGMVALSPIISALGEAFPDASQLATQMTNTFLCLIMVFFAIFAGSISRRIGRRSMMIISMALLIAASIGGSLMHSALWMVYFWSTLIGASIGLFVPAANSLMMDVYEDDTRTGIASIQSMMVGIGGVVLSLLTGALSSAHWNYAYLAFLLAVVPLAFAVRCMPTEAQLREIVPAEKQTAAAEANKASYRSVPSYVWIAALHTLVFAIIYFIFSTNISLYMTERSYTSTTLTGAITAVFMLGTCVSSLLLGKVMCILKRYTPVLAFGLLAISYLVLFSAENLVIIFIAAFVGGSTLGFIFPYFVITAGARVDPALSVISSSLIVSIAPNLGSFLSPVLITPLTNLFASGRIAPRFLLGAILAMAITVILIVINIYSKKHTQTDQKG
ncbi:MAG: MFS transporter [Oscillospiraceae bacterium]|nr:MFS transporter [Oscillospiraceae bacterium]